MSTWDDVGGDPCPGDLGALADYTGQLAAVAGHGHDLEQQLHTLHVGMGQLRWEGAGAAGVSDVIEQNLAPLAGFWCAHQDAATALGRYVDELGAWRAQAQAQLAAYSQATSDLAGAAARVSPANAARWDADARIAELNTQLKMLEAQHVAAAAVGHPNAHVDWEMHQVALELTSEHARRSAAGYELADAQACVQDAQNRQRAAQAAIDQIRGAVDECANETRTELLGLVGVVTTHNWLVRSYDDVVSGFDKTRIVREAFVDAWVKTAGWVNDLALACSWVPVLNGVLSGAGAVMNAPIAVTDAIRFCCGDHSASNLEQLIGTVPLKFALADHLEQGAKARASAGFVDRFSQDLKNSGKFEDGPLGQLKRAVWVSDARQATGYLRRVQAAPRLVGNAVTMRTLLAARALQYGVNKVSVVQDTIHEARDDVGFAHSAWDAAGRTSAGRAVENRLRAMPIDALPAVHTVRISMPGTAAVQ